MNENPETGDPRGGLKPNQLVSGMAMATAITLGGCILGHETPALSSGNLGQVEETLESNGAITAFVAQTILFPNEGIETGSGRVEDAAYLPFYADGKFFGAICMDREVTLIEVDVPEGSSLADFDGDFGAIQPFEQDLIHTEYERIKVKSVRNENNGLNGDCSLVRSDDGGPVAYIGTPKGG